MKIGIIVKNVLESKIKLVFESIKGLKFSKSIDIASLGFDPTKVHRSSPSGGRHLFRLLSLLQINSTDSILDIGCGCGSAIREFCKFPFEKIGGIEISKEIANIAIQNFHRLKEKRVSIVCEDACIYNHYEDFNFFYLYNPFPDEIFKIVLEKIINSFTIRKRPITIIYTNPICSRLIDERKRFEIAYKSKDRWGNDIFVYKLYF